MDTSPPHASLTCEEIVAVVQQTVEPLYFLANGDDLVAKHAAAGAWFQSLMLNLAA